MLNKLIMTLYRLNRSTFCVLGAYFIYI